MEERIDDEVDTGSSDKGKEEPVKQETWAAY